MIGENEIQCSIKIQLRGGGGGKTMKELPGPQCQPNKTCCTAGEALLTLSAVLWVRAQAYHQNPKKTEIIWSYGFEASLSILGHCTHTLCM